MRDVDGGSPEADPTQWINCAVSCTIFDDAKIVITMQYENLAAATAAWSQMQKEISTHGKIELVVKDKIQ